jgi:hypothetical protein
MAGGKINPATGRRMRDKVLPPGEGKPRKLAPKRSNGTIVPKGRLRFQQTKKTGR